MRSANGKRGTVLGVECVDAATLAQHIDITTQYLSELVRSGVLHYVKNRDGDSVPGRFDLKENCVSYIRFVYRRVKTPSNSAAAYDLARTERMRQQAATTAIRNALLMGTVYKASDVDDEVATMLLACRSRLLSIPSQVGRLLVGKEEIEEIIPILETAIEDALRDLQVPSRAQIQGKDRKMSEFVDVFGESDSDVKEEATI